MSRRMRRAAAITTWAYAAGFGGAALPVAKHLSDKGYLPSFRDWFTMYGGPWSERFAGHESERLVALLVAFFFVTLVASVFAWMLWRGSKLGAALSSCGCRSRRCSGTASPCPSRG